MRIDPSRPAPGYAEPTRPGARGGGAPGPAAREYALQMVATLCALNAAGGVASAAAPRNAKSSPSAKLRHPPRALVSGRGARAGGLRARAEGGWRAADSQRTQALTMLEMACGLKARGSHACARAERSEKSVSLRMPARANALAMLPIACGRM